MKLVTYETDGERRHGVLHGEPESGSIVDLGPGDLLALIDQLPLPDETFACDVGRLGEVTRPPAEPWPS